MEVAENTMLNSQLNTVEGTVSLSSSVGMANFLVRELAIDFINKNPLAVVKQNISNEYLDMIPAGLDIVIRGHKEDGVC